MLLLPFSPGLLEKLSASTETVEQKLSKESGKKYTFLYQDNHKQLHNTLPAHLPC